MTTTIAYLLLASYLFYLGFLMYASVMNVGWTKLSLFVKVLLAPPGVVFLVFDVVFNATIGSLVFWQLPNKLTLTLSKRMAALIAYTPTTWRGKIAARVVDTLLLPFTKDY